MFVQHKTQIRRTFGIVVLMGHLWSAFRKSDALVAFAAIASHMRRLWYAYGKMWRNCRHIRRSCMKCDTYTSSKLNIFIFMLAGTTATTDAHDVSPESLQLGLRIVTRRVEF